MSNEFVEVTMLGLPPGKRYSGGVVNAQSK